MAARAPDHGRLPSKPRKRQGTYWGIRTDITEYEVRALPVDAAIVGRLAGTGTHMRGLKPEVAERLVNWGYAVADAALRRYVPEAKDTEPRFPFEKRPLS